MKYMLKSIFLCLQFKVYFDIMHFSRDHKDPYSICLTVTVITFKDLKWSMLSRITYTDHA